jgi:hypothetical protein
VFSSFLFGPQPENTEGRLYTFCPCRGLATVFSSLLFGPQPEDTEGSRSQLAHRILGREFPIKVDYNYNLLNYIQGIMGRFCMLLPLLYTPIWGMFSLQFNRTTSMLYYTSTEHFQRASQILFKKQKLVNTELI